MAGDPVLLIKNLKSNQFYFVFILLREPNAVGSLTAIAAKLDDRFARPHFRYTRQALWLLVTTVTQTYAS